MLEREKMKKMNKGSHSTERMKERKEEIDEGCDDESVNDQK